MIPMLLTPPPRLRVILLVQSFRREINGISGIHQQLGLDCAETVYGNRNLSCWAFRAVEKLSRRKFYQYPEYGTPNYLFLTVFKMKYPNIPDTNDPMRMANLSVY